MPTLAEQPEHPEPDVLKRLVTVAMAKIAETSAQHAPEQPELDQSRIERETSSNFAEQFYGFYGASWVLPGRAQKSRRLNTQDPVR